MKSSEFVNEAKDICMRQPRKSNGMMLTLKRVRKDSDCPDSSDPPSTPNAKVLKRQNSDCNSEDERRILRVLRHKPWKRYHEFESSSDEESDCDQIGSIPKSKSSLPVGVIRGCKSCEACQKVTARWRSDAPCRPKVDEAPVYFPLEEEFCDPVKYIASICAEASEYGICRIVPPPSWRPPCPLWDSSKRKTDKFSTRVQRVDKLQIREVQLKKERKRKARRGRRAQRSGCVGRRRLFTAESDKDVCSDASDDEDGKFGFEPGPDFTLDEFEKYAEEFKEQYFGLRDQKEVSGNPLQNCEPTVECIEGEYWRIVEHATEQIEVLYGADIETTVFGSGFPKAKAGIKPSIYESSGWNLNNLARLPGSVLCFEEGEISGVLEPWLYVGMCFSSFCWHVEDHHLYSLNYMHYGSPKVWYGVPGDAATKLEETMKKQLPELFKEQPDLLHKLVTQLSPSVLKAAGVPIYRAVQKQGEFVITFPRAYHAGFNAGFNCAEAVNVAPIDWFPQGQMAVELYRQQRRKSSISHDKVLLRAVIKCIQMAHLPDTEVGGEVDAWKRAFSQHEVLFKVFKERVNWEHEMRAKVEDLLQIRKMSSDFDAVQERECSTCHYDLHLSAVGCECVNETYTCLQHVQELCACDRTKKYALYRYTLPELDAFVDALAGNSNALNCVDALIKSSERPKASKPVKEMDSLTFNAPNVPVDGRTAGTIDQCDVSKKLFSNSFHRVNNSLLSNNLNRQLTSLSESALGNGVCSAIKPTDCQTVSEKGKDKELSDISGDDDRFGSANSNITTTSNLFHGICQSFDIKNSAESCKTKSLLTASENPQCNNMISGSQVMSGRAANVELSWFPFSSLSSSIGPCTKSLLAASSNPPCNSMNSGMLVSPVPGKVAETKSPSFPFSSASNTANPRTMQERVNSSWSQPNQIQALVGQNLNCAQPLTWSPFNQKVDLLDTGRLVPAKPWYDKNTILPAGFRSRVLYPSILDPSKECFYISEILDSSHAGPLFKVSMEGYPNDMVIHSSIDRCWQMVQERLNLSIQLHQCLGRMGLPLIRAPEEVVGTELFGLTSPHIIKAIESLDWRHQCLEYWTARITAVELLENQCQMGMSNLNKSLYTDRESAFQIPDSLKHSFFRLV